MSEAETETVTDPGAEQVDEQPDEATETEEPETEPDIPLEEPEPDDEPEAAAPAGVSIEELEKVRNKLEQSATTWRNRVRSLLGDEADFLTVCELCDPIIPGFHFPAELEQPRDDIHARLLDVLRAPSGPDFLPDPYTNECPTCAGLGKTLTKSHVPSKTERVCPTCKGTGFLTQGEAPAAPTNGATGEIVYDLPNEGPMIDEGNDAWGSPKYLPTGEENINWGRMPQYKIPTLP